MARLRNFQCGRTYSKSEIISVCKGLADSLMFYNLVVTKRTLSCNLISARALLNSMVLQKEILDKLVQEL